MKMKRICFALSLFFISPFAQAQGVDSNLIKINVSLTKEQHKHALRCILGSWGTPDGINYVNDLIRGGFKTKSDTAKLTASVTLRLIVNVYRAASSKSEGIVAMDNESVSKALMGQIQGQSWAISQIQEIGRVNAETNKREKDEVEYLMQQLE
jgi:hypothetical protein